MSNQRRARRQLGKDNRQPLQLPPGGVPIQKQVSLPVVHVHHHMDTAESATVQLRKPDRLEIGQWGGFTRAEYASILAFAQNPAQNPVDLMDAAEKLIAEHDRRRKLAYEAQQAKTDEATKEQNE